METKNLVFIIIGLVVGCGLGYMGNYVVTEPKINSRALLRILTLFSLL